MFQTAGYPTHPSYFDYRTPPRTPTATPGGYQFYSPRHFSYAATPPTRGHARRATHDYGHYSSSTNTTPRKPAFYSREEYSSPVFTSAQNTPLRKPDYVSGLDGSFPETPSREMPSSAHRDNRGEHARSRFTTRRSSYVFVDTNDGYREEWHHYEDDACVPPSGSHRSQYSKKPHHRDQPAECRADRVSHEQVPVYSYAPSPAQDETKTRPRRSSYSTSKHHQQQQPPSRRPTTADKPAPIKATAEDARRAGIPAGYSYKNWNPNEEPILLLGSVFDADSLGKWIFDWTVFFFGPGTPMAKVAGDLWIMLIQLARKIKEAEECMPRIRQDAARDMVDDFLESGERLWQRFNKLLKICEGYMWRAAKREAAERSKNADPADPRASSEKITMGRNSGCEFVDAIFGRDRELERTEKLMSAMRLWSMRFDANCDSVLKNPAA